MRPLVWFRSDLRVRDNTALSNACQTSDNGVVGVFAICPRQWKEHDWAPIKVDFLLRNLIDLSVSLQEINIPLLLIEVPRFDEVPKRLIDLSLTHRCDSIWFNREYELNERRRDDKVTRIFERAGKSVHAFTDQVIVPPDRLRTTQGKVYTVFTPFKKRWVAAVEEAGGVRCFRKPGRQKAMRIRSDPVPRDVVGFRYSPSVGRFKSGEKHALSRLRSFISRRIESYRDHRDLPALNGTSTLSPYLTLGVLSPRQGLKAALNANRGRFDSGQEGVTTWVSELVWREFYRHVLVGFPRVCMGEPFDHRTHAIQWRESEVNFQRWQEGKTGIPIVDAGMRQLKETGWMHNRLRMIVAMFLSKNLFLDWRRGERHFMRHLIDGDLASNNGGWQWSASVGTDAAPYFRVFNPVSQSERFDPDGAYIRTYVPELSAVEGKAVHMPYERSPETFAGLGYPEPLVDLKKTRQRAIDKFKRLTRRWRP